MPRSPACAEGRGWAAAGQGQLRRPALGPRGAALPLAKFLPSRAEMLLRLARPPRPLAADIQPVPGPLINCSFPDADRMSLEK